MKAYSLLIGILLVLTNYCWADEGDLPAKTSGTYLGIGGGFSKIDAQGDAFSISGEDFSFRLLGGYRFAQYSLPFNLDIGFEAAYVDLGEVDKSLGSNEVIIDMDGLMAAGTVYWPINRYLDVIGKAGVYLWDAQVVAAGTELADESSTDLVYGLGIAWQTGTPFGAQFEIETVDALDGVWNATLSATYQFK